MNQSFIYNCLIFKFSFFSFLGTDQPLLLVVQNQVTPPAMLQQAIYGLSSNTQNRVPQPEVTANSSGVLKEILYKYS